MVIQRCLPREKTHETEEQGIFNPQFNSVQLEILYFNSLTTNSTDFVAGCCTISVGISQLTEPGMRHYARYHPAGWYYRFPMYIQWHNGSCEFSQEVNFCSGDLRDDATPNMQVNEVIKLALPIADTFCTTTLSDIKIKPTFIVFTTSLQTSELISSSSRHYYPSLLIWLCYLFFRCCTLPAVCFSLRINNIAK